MSEGMNRGARVRGVRSERATGAATCAPPAAARGIGARTVDAIRSPGCVMRRRPRGGVAATPMWARPRIRRRHNWMRHRGHVTSTAAGSRRGASRAGRARVPAESPRPACGAARRGAGSAEGRRLWSSRHTRRTDDARGSAATPTTAGACVRAPARCPRGKVQGTCSASDGAPCPTTVAQPASAHAHAHAPPPCVVTRRTPPRLPIRGERPPCESTPPADD